MATQPTLAAPALPPLPGTPAKPATPPAPAAPASPPPAKKSKKEKPASAPASPPPAQQVASGGDDVASLKARIAQLEQAIAGKAGVEHQIAEKLATIQAIAELPVEVRTQQMADEKFTGPRSFFIQLQDNPGITIKAHSPEEAAERYRQHCGIRHSEHQPFVTEVPSDQPQQPAAPAFGKAKKK